MKKTLAFALGALLAGASVLPLWAESEATLGDDIAELGSELQSAGKAALNVVGSALNAASDVIGKTARSLTAKACLGSWTFRNGKCATTLTCADDGSMELVQARGKSVTVWRGSYTATASAISFHAVTKAAKGAFFSSNDPVDENWLVTYRAATTGDELRLVSANIPADANGYDFSQPTLFIKQTD